MLRDHFSSAFGAIDAERDHRIGILGTRVFRKHTLGAENRKTNKLDSIFFIFFIIDSLFSVSASPATLQNWHVREDAFEIRQEFEVRTKVMAPLTDTVHRVDGGPTFSPGTFSATLS
jgi:hypothetical protein